MTESNPTSVECPVCGESFDPTAAGGWCTNSECGEWKYEGEAMPDPDDVSGSRDDHVPLDAITGSADGDGHGGEDPRENGEAEAPEAGTEGTEAPPEVAGEGHGAGPVTNGGGGPSDDVGPPEEPAKGDVDEHAGESPARADEPEEIAGSPDESPGATSPADRNDADEGPESGGSSQDEIEDRLDAIDDRLEDVDDSADGDDGEAASAGGESDGEDEGETTIECPLCGETLHERDFFIHDCEAESTGGDAGDEEAAGAAASGEEAAGAAASGEEAASAAASGEEAASSEGASTEAAAAETGGTEAASAEAVGAESSSETPGGGESATQSPGDEAACPSCGDTVGPDANFCPSCGEDLTGSEATGGLETCPGCGESVTPDDQFCPSCGEDLDSHRRGDAGGTAGTTPEAEAHAEDQTGAQAEDQAEDQPEDHPEHLVLRARGREVTVGDGDSVGREFRRIITRTGGDEEDAVRIHREHVRFVRDDGRFDLVDLGANPTAVNGRKLEKGDRTSVGPGDTITLSNVLTAEVEAP